MGWHYSKGLKKYVSLEPLKLNSRVREAAKAAGINLEFDDDKNICMLGFHDVKRLIQALGSSILTPEEYFALMDEGDKALNSSLTSNYFAEFLDRVYVRKGGYVDNPECLNEKEVSLKNLKPIAAPVGRPGWFNPKNNIDKNSHPIDFITEKSDTENLWKYWSPDFNPLFVDGAVALRGYVSSVDMPSYDLGCPMDVKYPKLMIRETRHDLPHGVDENEIAKKREIELDEIGKHRLQTNDFNNLNEIKSQCLENYLRKCQNEINKAEDVVFVVGHRNPDSDAAISCIFEAYRNYLINPEKLYVPVLQSEAVPAEIEKLLGDLSRYVILDTDKRYKKVLDENIASFIFVDHNYQPDIQKYVVSMIDHHEPSIPLDNLNIPKTFEFLGATTSIIMKKFLAMGYSFDNQLSKVLLGAILMDSENLSDHKATEEDIKLVNHLTEKTGIVASEFFASLMGELLKVKDIDTWFNRDYKEYDLFGFAVLKVKDGEIINEDEVRQKLQEKNSAGHLATSLAKLVYYKDAEAVHESIIVESNPDFNVDMNPTIIEYLKQTLLQINKDVELGVEPDCIRYNNLGMQLSRKFVVPQLQEIVSAYNEYYFSNELGVFVARDFLRSDDDRTLTDDNGRVNNISFPEAKKLANRNGGRLLSASEYFKLLKEAEHANDHTMTKSLRNGEFLEFLDTTNKDVQDYLYASPGLILTDDINPETGLPEKIYPPNIYGEKDFWRYWSFPDNDNDYVLVRGHIFLLGSSCLDGKVGINECFHNVGLRMVKDDISPPEIKLRKLLDTQMQKSSLHSNRKETSSSIENHMQA
ncbi:MAG: DHH family phosphoesterase [Firmicutes bacterium]|nr:DHH family phosphoesterase [Bacillota bacterium]